MLRSVLAALVAASALAAFPALAGVGKTWTTSGTEQFAAGELDGVAVRSTGEVELAPAVEEIEGLEAELVWDAQAALDGTVYVATGSPAAVYAVRGNRAELLHKSDEKHVLSVLPLPDGSVLAGTAPQGIIYRIDRGGKAEVLVDLEDAYVWDMAIDPFNRIYCATGPEGRLLRLNRAGEVTEVLKAKQINLMCVATDAEGTVYAGSAPDGYVYRVEHGEKATVLYDADEDEVHALVVDEAGVVYACTAQSQPPGPRGGPPQSPPGEQSGQAAVPIPSPPAAAGAPATHNSIYRIAPGEGAVLLARFDKMFLLSLCLLNGEVIAGTGTDGRLVAVRPDMTYRILTEFDAAHVTAMARDAEGDVIVGTSNAGALWRLRRDHRPDGTLISKPFDAGYLSRWGRLWWKEKLATGQSIRIKVRTGNSGEPDEHWSEWTRWANRSDGEPLDVPIARFAQFSAELSTRPITGSPLLLEVNVSYRQANRKPRIVSFTLDGERLLEEQQGGPSGRTQPSRPPASRRPRQAEPATRNLVWRATDPNDDELRYDLYYRGVDETDWMAVDDDIEEDTDYAWDTSRLPDGYYCLKLVARDDAARPRDEALADERITSPLLIDNRPPAVVDISARRLADGTYEITGIARDEHGQITNIEVSHNAGDWAPVFPTDGIFDSLEEPFSHRTDILEPGEHVFVFAATDRRENAGSGKLVVRVEPEPE